MSDRAQGYESARPDIQALVPQASTRILDLGCSSGALGAALKARTGAEVVGVELDPALAATAEGQLDRVVVGDAEAVLAGEELGRFDCVVAADVLEHLRGPEAALGRAAGLLEPGGVAIISLPNVRYWETFVQVGMRGTWPRRDTGLFDRTHLRWFTLVDARRLLAGAGLEVVESAPQYPYAREGGAMGALVRLLSHTPIREFLAYQNVLVGRRRV